jgi:hypothetical protein
VEIVVQVNGKLRGRITGAGRTPIARPSSRGTGRRQRASEFRQVFAAFLGIFSPLCG